MSDGRAQPGVNFFYTPQARVRCRPLSLLNLSGPVHYSKAA